jgi:hypothetical protein
VRMRIVLAVAVVLVALIVVGRLMAPPGEHTREHIPSFCERLHRMDINPIQRCRPDEHRGPVTVEV